MSSVKNTCVGGFTFKEPQCNLYNTLDSFRRAKLFCDIKLKVGHKEFHAHKIVLAAASVYFKDVFSSQFPEAHQPELVMETVDPDIMEIIVNFAYSNVVKITNSNILEVMLASNFLQVESLVNACCNHLEEYISVEVCFGVLGLQNLCSERFSNLAEKALNFIVNNFACSSQKLDFLELESNSLITIIKSNALKVDTEDVVFEAATRWLCFKEERYSVLEQVLCHIRLAYVDPTILQDWVERIDLSNSPSCMKLVEEARKYHLLPYRRTDVLSSIRIRRFSSLDFEALVIQNRDDDEKNLICVSRNGDIVKNIKYPPEKTRTIIVSSYNNVILAGCWECIYEYNNETDEWLQIASNVKPRYLFGLCELDGCWYSIGGKIVGGRTSDVVEKYDPVSKMWKQLTFMPVPLSSPAVVSHKGMIFVLGGSLSDNRGCDLVQRYDPRRKTWTMLSNIPVKLQYPAACVLDGMIYVFNFLRDLSNDGRRVLVYNVSTDKWHDISIIPRSFLGGPSVMEGCIYVLTNDKGNNSSIMKYTPISDSWVPFGNFIDLKSKVMCGPLTL